MGDKGKKDKNKHDKQVNKAKNAQNEANKKKQEKTYQQKKGRDTILYLLSIKVSVPFCIFLSTFS